MSFLQEQLLTLKENRELLAELEAKYLLVSSPIAKSRIENKIRIIKNEIDAYTAWARRSDYITPHLDDIQIVKKVHYLAKPVVNPYEGVSGRPAYPPNFIGRDEVLEQIQNIWKTKNQLPAIILYGHRRMGKTSILRNLKLEENSPDILVFIDMQIEGLVDNTAQFFLDIAEKIEEEAREVGLETGNFASEENFQSAGNARRTLDKLLKLLDRQMQGRRLILAIDEFEIIQGLIEEKQIEASVLEYLRGINQRYNWLGLIFAGLHELEEMGRDYNWAFYGNVKHIKISYLQLEDARKLIIQADNPNFELAYEPELVDDIYFLTYGQPYLIQLLCSELVYQWNEKWEKQQGHIAPLLTINDLDKALTDRFFMHADYYFEGVWTQVGENEQRLMALIADWQEKQRGLDGMINPVPSEEARKLVNYEVEEFKQAVLNLERRDLMLELGGLINFSSEAMRRWVVRRNLQRH